MTIMVGAPHTCNSVTALLSKSHNPLDYEFGMREVRAMIHKLPRNVHFPPTGFLNAINKPLLVIRRHAHIVFAEKVRNRNGFIARMCQLVREADGRVVGEQLRLCGSCFGGEVIEDVFCAFGWVGVE
jgi:hypothetical protein